MAAEIDVEYWSAGDDASLGLERMPLKDIPKTGEVIAVDSGDQPPRPLRLEVLGHDADHAPDGTVRRVRLRVKELGR